MNLSASLNLVGLVIFLNMGISVIGTAYDSAELQSKASISQAYRNDLINATSDIPGTGISPTDFLSNIPTPFNMLVILQDIVTGSGISKIAHNMGFPSYLTAWIQLIGALTFWIGILLFIRGIVTR